MYGLNLTDRILAVHLYCLLIHNINGKRVYGVKGNNFDSFHHFAPVS